MKTIFAILAVVFYLSAFFGCMAAKTSIHEVQGWISVLVATLFAVGAALIEAIDLLRKDLNRITPPK